MYTLSVTPRLKEIAGNWVALGKVILISPGLLAFMKGSSWPVKGRTWREFSCNDARNAADRSGSFVFSFPVSRDSVAEIEAFNGVREIAHEIPAAQFAIGENFKAKLFLFCKHMLDVPVFELAEAASICAGLAGLE